MTVPLAFSHWCPSLDDSGDGTTTLNDLSGSFDGTLTNMDAATDWVSDTGEGGVRALDFDGSNDRVATSLDNQINWAGPWSATAWIKPAVLTSTRAVLSWGSGAATPYGFWSLGTKNANVHLDVYSGGAYSGGTLTVNSWHHIGVVYTSASNVGIYLDGVLLTTKSGMAITARSGFPLNIGYQPWGSINNFLGRVDDLRMFDVAISLSDMVNLASVRAYQDSTPTRRHRQSQGIPA